MAEFSSSGDARKELRDILSALAMLDTGLHDRLDAILTTRAGTCSSCGLTCCSPGECCYGEGCRPSANVGPQELAVVLHQREADALLALLEQALNAGMEPGIGLRREDAYGAGVKVELARAGVRP